LVLFMEPKKVLILLIKTIDPYPQCKSLYSQKYH
jgi:hypothetical protein